MAYVYVYAPCSGTVKEVTHYCNGNPHTVVSCIGGSKPIDIHTGSQVDIYLHVTSIAVRAKVTRCSGMCLDTSKVPWIYGLRVDLYLDTAATQYLGTVGYGHVDDRIANGTYDCRTPLRLGRLPSACNCPCSGAIHVHMQGNGEFVGFVNCANTPVTKGTSWIYRWLANV